MRFGCDANNARLRPFPGGRASCPLCQNPLIAKCGEIKVWHWSHKGETNCDPWKEHETEWHLNWKSRFPDDWQEVIIEKNGKKHIADIITPEGMVIEFQNSSISTSTIRAREYFYDEMIWVVNATHFIDQLSFGSVVNRRLRNLDAEYEARMRELRTDDQELIKEYDQDIKSNANKQSQENNRIAAKTKELDGLTKALMDLNEIAIAIYAGWENDQEYSNHHIHAALAQVRSTLAPQYKSVKDQRNKVNTKLTHLKKQLNNWEGLRDFSHEGKILKRGSFIYTKDFDCKEVLCLERRSLHTFFPKVFRCNSAAQLNLYQTKEQEYEFAVDPTEKLRNLQVESLNCCQELDALYIDKNEFISNIKTVISEYLKTEISKINKVISEHQQTLAGLVKGEDILTERQKNFMATMRDEREKRKKQLEREKTDKRFKIMREGKGIYTFTWKRERKSWLEAEFPVFLDIGEDYLFERKGDGVLQKVMVKDFMKLHLDTK